MEKDESPVFSTLKAGFTVFTNPKVPFKNDKNLMRYGHSFLRNFYACFILRQDYNFTMNR